MAFLEPFEILLCETRRICSGLEVHLAEWNAEILIGKNRSGPFCWELLSARSDHGTRKFGRFFRLSGVRPTVKFVGVKSSKTFSGGTLIVIVECSSDH